MFANVPKKRRQGLNELNIIYRVLEITSPNFRKCKNLECNLIGILGREWYLIVSIPDLCTLTYFVIRSELRLC